MGFVKHIERLDRLRRNFAYFGDALACVFNLSSDFLVISFSGCKHVINLWSLGYLTFVRWDIWRWRWDTIVGIFIFGIVGILSLISHALSLFQTARADISHRLERGESVWDGESADPRSLLDSSCNSTDDVTTLSSAHLSSTSFDSISLSISSRYSFNFAQFLWCALTRFSPR